mmetsp:Transcript_26101/g.57021  ORF Transcript_26101/g.57021 Transcript_26101/m.57021 type:complete len:697 (+) Transcript_26101:262-2352(+)
MLACQPQRKSVQAARTARHKSALSVPRHKLRKYPSFYQPLNRSPVATHATAGATIAEPHKAPAQKASAGHSALLHGLGDLGDVSATHMPWLLRVAHARSRTSGCDSTRALQEAARGLTTWRAALDRGLLPDDDVIAQLIISEPFAAGHTVAELHWPEEPLATMLVRVLSKLGVARLARKYPAVKEALLRSVLETVHKYHKALSGEQEEAEQRERDANGNLFKTASELRREEEMQRAARTNNQVGASPPPQAAAPQPAPTQAPAAAAPTSSSAAPAVPPERRLAMDLAKALYVQWQAPMDALSKAGKAFEGLEALLGGAGGSFDLSGNIWKRGGWSQMDSLRRRLEELRELRDLVRSLGRGGGWGPLRRAPIQHLDFNGRPGLLRTVLEAQETRGLTRSDDISRLLPAEAATLARGRVVRQAKLLFYARLAEKALQCYERDGWGEFPTTIVPERREIRPTADRGPILLCVDTSGSMRGPRETVAKALALECMRAAREQERNCYVYAFSGPQEVRELELNMDMRSVTNLLDFLEKVFNGGSDFNEPVKRCLDRLTAAEWANSDILLVSDGELRQPASDIMRKLSGAKEKLGLRVHGLVVGSPEKKRADPAVLRALCTNILPNGKTEVLVSEFTSWASVQGDSAFNLDWDDVEGNTRRRLAGLHHEKLRQEAMRRKRAEARAEAKGAAGGDGGRRPRKH